MPTRESPELDEDAILLTSGHLSNTHQVPATAGTARWSRGEASDQNKPPQAWLQAVHAQSREVTQVPAQVATFCISQANTGGHVPTAGPQGGWHGKQDRKGILARPTLHFCECVFSGHVVICCELSVLVFARLL